MFKTRAVSKYLTHYVEPEVRLLDELAVPSKRFALVIPAYDETEGFVERLSRSPYCQDTLLILVVNQPDDLTENNCKNQTLIQTLKHDDWLIEDTGILSLINFHGLHILLVDRTRSRPIPAKKGVGLARKIGGDLALVLIEKDLISYPWIYSSDADCHLPENYFASLSNESSSALVFNFLHVDDGSLTSAATLEYEQALKYYQAGLAWAGSPYAFFTLGSALAVRASHYAQVRGFPQRAAGEDFYLLNKLAKVGRVQFVPEVVIHIASRVSHRVPFGTGPKVKHILELKERAQAYCYYSPQVFMALREVLDHKRKLCEEPNQLKNLSAPCRAGLEAIDFDRFITHAQTLPEKHKAKHFDDWFDAFQTMKFIHALQSGYYPAIPLAEALIAAKHQFTP